MAAAKSDDRRSAAALLYREWYKTKDWYKIRSKRLKAEPHCRICMRQKAFDPSYVIDESQRLIVDHVKQHKGDAALFFNYDNTQTLCQSHHSSTKQQMERGRRFVAIGVDGWPLEDR